MCSPAQPECQHAGLRRARLAQARRACKPPIEQARAPAGQRMHAVTAPQPSRPFFPPLSSLLLACARQRRQRYLVTKGGGKHGRGAQHHSISQNVDVNVVLQEVTRWGFHMKAIVGVFPV